VIAGAHEEDEAGGGFKLRESDNVRTQVAVSCYGAAQSGSQPEATLNNLVREAR
jgi:hypothetical protein